MIIGSHFLLYSKDADADRAFLRDALGLRPVDAGHRWLIFGMSPAEAAVHPLDEGFSREHAGEQMLNAVVYFMCDDLEAQIADLKAKSVECAPVQTARWGVTTSISLPSGGKIGLYEPRHPTALHLKLPTTEAA